jgi:EamA-like transporter family.
MAYLFLGINLFMKFIQTFFNKKTSDSLSGTAAYLAYGAYRYIFCALLALALVAFSGGASASYTPMAFFSSGLAAAALAVNLICTLEAMKSGAIVLCTLVGGAGLLLPCIAGILWFGEPMSVWQFAGIALLFVSAYLLAGYSKELYTKFSFKTLLLLVGSMLSNGLIMVAQKLFSLYVEGGSASVFSMLMFAMAAACYIVGLLAYLAHERGQNSQHNQSSSRVRSDTASIRRKPLTPTLLGYGAILSVALLAINQLSTELGRMLPSAILFSVNDGGGTIISAVTAAIFFREKLTPRALAGIGIGISALLVINFF